MFEDAEKLEKDLRKLLGQIKKHLSPDEAKEISTYIGQNELEAAMETLVDLLEDKSCTLSASIVKNAEKLAKDLGMPGEAKRIAKKMAP